MLKQKTFRCPKLLTLVNSLGSQHELACVCCGRNDGTVVAAHANQGKGMGIKATDSSVMALAYACHVGLDQPGPGAMGKEERREFEKEMNRRTLVALLELGYLVPVLKLTLQPLSK
jgi:hypothetical protein